jgi:hypothetical protein
VSGDPVLDRLNASVETQEHHVRAAQKQLTYEQRKLDEILVERFNWTTRDQ